MKSRRRRIVYSSLVLAFIFILLLTGDGSSGGSPTQETTDAIRNIRPPITKEFRYCTMLNNSTLLQPVIFFEIDNTALELYHYLGRGDVNERDMKRLSCWITVMGPIDTIEAVVGPVNRTSRILQHLHTPTYFPSFYQVPNWSLEPLTVSSDLSIQFEQLYHDLNYTIPSIPSSVRASCAIQTQKKYKIVYILFIHSNVQQAIRLLDLIHHPDAFYLIHVDTKSPSIHQLLQLHVYLKYTQACSGANIMVTSKHDIVWGGGSMVTATLDLLFMIESLHYDYVINMSGYCVPLYDTPTLYSMLTARSAAAPGKKGHRAWVHVMEDTEPDRVDTLAVPKRDSGLRILDHFRSFSHFQVHSTAVTAWKQDQWMILTPSVVKLFRSEEAMELLAWMEYSFIPDEHYFATYLINYAQFHPDSLQFSKHEVQTAAAWFLKFDGYHPKFLSVQELEQPLPTELMARKIKLDPTMVNYFQDRWKRTNKPLIID